MRLNRALMAKVYNTGALPTAPPPLKLATDARYFASLGFLHRERYRVEDADLFKHLTVLFTK